MDKFQAGDRIIQDSSGRLATVISRRDTVEECYIIQSDDNKFTGTSLLYNIAIWQLHERAEALPQMPSSVLYRSTRHEIEVSNEYSSVGEVFIGFRRQDTEDDFRGLHLTADEALQLSHDILRYAMQAKRKEKEEE